MGFRWLFQKVAVEKLLAANHAFWFVFFPILEMAFHSDFLAGLEHDFTEERAVYAAPCTTQQVVKSPPHC